MAVLGACDVVPIPILLPSSYLSPLESPVGRTRLEGNDVSPPLLLLLRPPRNLPVGLLSAFCGPVVMDASKAFPRDSAGEMLEVVRAGLVCENCWGVGFVL